MKTIPIGIIRAIDELHRVKNELKLLEAEHTELADTIKQYMTDHNLDTAGGKLAQAILTIRENKELDPEAYWEVLEGDVDKLLASVSVRIEANPKTGRAGARSFVGEDTIDSICSVTEIPVITIKKLKVQKPIKVIPDKPTRKTRTV